MTNRNICLFINLFVCFFAKGQHVFTAKPYALNSVINDTTHQTISTGRPFSNLTVNPFNNSPIKTVPPTFYYNSIGFFCQKELQIEKALRFPVKLRLGSVAYTDEMEGKGKRIIKPSNRK